MIPIKLQGIFSNNMLFHTSPAHYSRKFGDKSLEESFRFFFMVTEIFFFFLCISLMVQTGAFLFFFLLITPFNTFREYRNV